MILPLLILAILYLIMTNLPLLPGALPLEAGVATTAILGFLLLASFFFGKVSARFSLPLLTGYLLAGILFGPYGLKLFSIEHVEQLSFINSVALALIAFAVGGELDFESLSSRLKNVLATTLFQMVIVFAGVTAFFYLLFTLSPFNLGLEDGKALFAALILGVIATANSPATALAIINESRAKGRITETTLGVTVVKDVAVIALFALVVSWVQSTVGGAGELESHEIFLELAMEVAFSILMGAAVGALMVIYLNTIKGELLVFTLGAAVLASEASSLLELNELLVCIAAGFVAKNFSREGGSFIEAIERSSMPVFVVFFSLIGASLDLLAVRQMWVVAVAYFAIRLFLTWLSTGVALRLVGESDRVKKYLWSGFVSQAGVSLGLAVVVKNQFPDWGASLVTLIIASVAINQIVGPVIFKHALTAGGEAGRGSYGSNASKKVQ